MRLPTAAVDAALARIFKGRLRVMDNAPKQFDVRFHADLSWSVRAVGEGGVAAFDGRAVAKSFSFGWRRASDDRTHLYFAGAARPALASSAVGNIVIGDPKGHRVELRPKGRDGKIALEARVGASPIKPSSTEVVVSLGLGEAELAIADGADTLMGWIGASELTLAETRLPTKAAPVRTTLWGDAMIGPRPRSDPKAMAAAGAQANGPEGGDDYEPPRVPSPERDIVSSVGQMRVAALARDLRRVPKDAKPGATKGQLGEKACACVSEEDGASTRSAARRLFQAASGHLGGASESTVFVVHDCVQAMDAPSGLSVNRR